MCDECEEYWFPVTNHVEVVCYYTKHELTTRDIMILPYTIQSCLPFFSLSTSHTCQVLAIALDLPAFSPSLTPSSICPSSLQNYKKVSIFTGKINIFNKLSNLWSSVVSLLLDDRKQAKKNIQNPVNGIWLKLILRVCLVLRFHLLSMSHEFFSCIFSLLSCQVCHFKTCQSDNQ